MTIGQRIAQAREQQNLTQYALAKKMGIHPSTIKRWEEDGTSPKGAQLALLAKALDVSSDWFISTDPNLANFFENQIHPKKTFNIPMASDMVKDIPILGTAAGSDGTGALQLSNDTIGYAYRAPSLTGRNGVYALYVQGDSMEPKLNQGDLIIVDPNIPPKAGDDVVVSLKENKNGDTDAYIKTFRRFAGNQILCKQYNPEKELSFDRMKYKIHKVLKTEDFFG